jgi:D-alanyl-lipoteichoic acid acyltransferase DltB (MBOAT superfamily)
MSDLIFSTAALVALCYFGLATATARLMPVGTSRSVVFALINIAAVWLIFFLGTQSGTLSILLYILFLSVFWMLLRIAQTRSRHLFLLGFVPPIAWLVLAKTTGLLFFVGLSYMLFRCAHVEWELSKRKIKMMSFPDYIAHCFFAPTFLIGPISPYSYYENSFNAGAAYKKENTISCLLRILKGAAKVVVISGVFLQISPDAFIIDYRTHKIYEIFIAIIGFYIYMYANFSGLNDVSIGAAGLMGIAVKENFNQPYFSQSITEMYTRWHMTLSEWMRDIVFFPLAAFLMRRATWLTRYQSSAVATMTVFILFGLWHSGASLGWQYWLMGFLLGVAVVVEFYLGQWVRQWPETKRFALPPTVARVARTLYANLYFASAASLMSINWQERGVTPVDWLRGIGRFL